MNEDSSAHQYLGRHSRIILLKPEQLGQERTSGVPAAPASPTRSAISSPGLSLDYATNSIKNESTESAKSRFSQKLKSTLATIAALITLVFGYLAVAVNAHWFPWHQQWLKPKVPSFTVDFDRGALSNSKWNVRVVNLSDGLSHYYAKVVKLNLTFESEQYGYNFFSAKVLNRGGQLLYAKWERENIKMVEVAEAPRAQFLIFKLIRGPGSELGYVTSTAASLRIDGYFQIGRPDTGGAGALILNLIPVQPPN
jgi:hypothetical protein